MKKYSGFSARTVLLVASLIVLFSCKDTWNEHYSYKNDNNYPVDKLDVTLSAIDGYDKFYKVLETTYLYDRKGKPYSPKQNFLELLQEDQFLTIWAPSNNSLSDSVWNEYMNPKKNDSLNYEVGEKFLKNHIARFKHTISNIDTSKVFMMNGKPILSIPTTMGGQTYHDKDKNIRCSNGILHCLDGKIKYLPSIYEYIVSDIKYKGLTGLGDWFKGYTKEEIDQNKSVALGVDQNGEKIWVDAVMIESNVYLDEFGYINSEDSTYALVLPTPELWQSEYDRIKEYFMYNEPRLNNDTLQEYYTTAAMMTDMFFNMNEKVQLDFPDSVYSTLYSSRENRIDKKPYHVFSYPNDETNGLFGSCYETVECSNGTIYRVDKWPFVDTLTFLRPIKLEAENYRNLSSLFSLYQRTVNSIGGKELENPVQVMRISSSTKGEHSWDARFFISDNLKGKYRIKVVIAPNLEDKKPVLIHPTIYFNGDVLLDSTWTEYQSMFGMLFPVQKQHLISNDVSKIDTLELGVVDLPYCTYDMSSSPLSVQLSSRVTSENINQYTSELWLDGIILEPVVE